MISKAETLQCLKKMGMMVADDQSIVTVLLPKEVTFEVGVKDVRQKLRELGYESSFCVKQSKDAVMQSNNEYVEREKDASVTKEEKLGEEEVNSYIALDADGEFSLDADGQFTLGLEF